jgi:Skp family chaperone for outer membrane proteins
MTRILIASVLTSVVAVGSAAAQTNPPAGQTRPPTQTPPPQTPPPTTTPPPLVPQTAKPPAPAVPFPADAKVGFVALQSVVNDSKLGKAGTAQINDLGEKMKTEVGAMQKKIADLQKEIQQGQGVLSTSAIQLKASQLDQSNRDLQHLQDNWQAKLQEAQEQLLNGFSEKVVPIVEEIRVEKGLWVIFAVQGADGGLAVLAANPGLDLSPEVVKRLDAKFPGPAGK